MRELFCNRSKNERSVAVALFENALYDIRKSNAKTQPCLFFYVVDNNQRTWEVLMKHPIYESAPQEIKTIMRNIYIGVHKGLRDFIQASCSRGPNINQYYMTKKEGSKLIRQLYKALCPDNNVILKPRKLTEDNMPQLMLSLFVMAQMSNERKSKLPSIAKPPADIDISKVELASGTSRAAFTAMGIDISPSPRMREMALRRTDTSTAMALPVAKKTCKGREIVYTPDGTKMYDECKNRDWLCNVNKGCKGMVQKKNGNYHWLVRECDCEIPGFAEVKQRVDGGGGNVTNSKGVR